MPASSSHLPLRSLLRPSGDAGLCGSSTLERRISAGTSLLTVATPTLYGGQVLVIREMHWCQWGSPYLDAYGEEDQDLRRGRPLYLNRSVWVDAHARVAL